MSSSRTQLCRNWSLADASFSVRCDSLPVSGYRRARYVAETESSFYASRRFPTSPLLPHRIYPATFKDTTGTGTGDLQGVLEKIPYLAELGIDAIWISPFYKSPQVSFLRHLTFAYPTLTHALQADLGYDISDYTAVHEPYGSVEDIDKIVSCSSHCSSRFKAHFAHDEQIAEASKHNIKILADLVVNHCSNEHEWFKEARSSRDSPKRDWFIWRDAKIVDGQRECPNNCESSLRVESEK